MAFNLYDGLMLATSNKDRISPVGRWVPTTLIVGVLLIYGIAFLGASATMYSFMPEYRDVQNFGTDQGRALHTVFMLSIATPIALVYVLSYVLRRRKHAKEQAELREARKKVDLNQIPVDKIMHCPRCNAALVRGRAWLACPSGHGFLINGSQMNSERKSDAAIEYTPSTSLTQGADVLSCPSCGSVMTPTPYQSTGAVIDVCTHCAYRWLDGNEVAPILGE